MRSSSDRLAQHQRSAMDADEIERQMALIEKSQQLAGHFPNADALGRARSILEGKISAAEAYAELDAKYPKAEK